MQRMFMALSLLALSQGAAAERQAASPPLPREMYSAEASVAFLAASCGPCSDCLIVGEACDANGWKGKCIATDIKCKTGGGVLCVCKAPTSLPPDPDPLLIALFASDALGAPGAPGAARCPVQLIRAAP